MSSADQRSQTMDVLRVHTQTVAGEQERGRQKQRAGSEFHTEGEPRVGGAHALLPTEQAEVDRDDQAAGARESVANLGQQKGQLAQQHRCYCQHHPHHGLRYEERADGGDVAVALAGPQVIVDHRGPDY
ncbi:MAG TPA: hypothetical protein VED59_09375 [Acidimicrobiales bacterium]|nr:hypothetical protein [Acidimicrobiales bacterium]